MRRQKIKKPFSYYHAAWYSTHLIAIYFHFNQKAVFLQCLAYVSPLAPYFFMAQPEKKRFLISAQFGGKI